MQSLEREIPVSFRHRVFFTEGAFRAANPLLADLLTASPGPARVLVTLDAGLVQARPDLPALVVGYFEARRGSARLVAPPVVLPGGEAAKNDPALVGQVQAAIEQHGICRHSYVLAVGGGAHLDVVGFAAATAHRGVRHVRLPSTTLAQADSGVGVKNGVNAFGKKNFLGAFAPPFAVLNDFDLLSTLPARERRGGLAEAVKVALIRDAAFFETIERDAARLAAFEPEPVRALIRRSAELHVNHIASSGDPFEFGSARPLDFGHWSAHKLEQLSDYRIRHGEAVAIGVALDTLYSRRVGLLDAAEGDRVLALLGLLGFDLFAEALRLREPSGRLAVLRGLEEFREHLGGELTVTLLAGVGRGVEVHTMNEAIVADAIEELAWRARPRCGAGG
ncbi:MAG: 3-dehydroquinate synthase [Verrucomicrobia bacterium]|nr:3-dehydroquinate synthase [Verrucomicrobiota bacterium]